jgi:dihydropteroate synthase
LNHRFHTSITISGRTVPMGDKTIMMGVLNVTPDSFSDGGRYLKPADAILRGLNLVTAGADWIDVGGESTRPGALPVTPAEEIRRVFPVIQGIRAKLPRLPISIDTTKAEVAEEAIRAGANILNDVSGLRFDPGIARVAKAYDVPLILMHMRGRPESMQRKPFVKSIWRSLHEGLRASVGRAVRFGVRPSQLIIDPGLGFGKSRRQNFEILANLHRLNQFGLPILAGASRKSFVQAVAGGENVDGAMRKSQFWPLTGASGSGPGFATPRPRSRISGKRGSLELLDAADVAVATAAILGGAHIVRVHDVAVVLPAARLADALLATM